MLFENAEFLEELMQKITISEKLISIPPYVSTTWAQVSALQTIDNQLHILLKGGQKVVIPDLTAEQIDEIFKHHTAFLERGISNLPPLTDLKSFQNILPPFIPESSIQIALGGTDGLNPLQHSPNNSDMPELPEEVVSKLASIIQLLIPPQERSQVLGVAESHCNCMHCQVVRHIAPTSDVDSPLAPAEEVKAEEISFCEWRVADLGENQFKVSHRLFPNDSYQVFLGQPVGCTCGKSGCEHILAALRS
jgi:hypothetical protein